MVERARKRDGNKFWGCHSYPDCEGTRGARPGDFMEIEQYEEDVEENGQDQGNYNPNAGLPDKPGKTTQITDGAGIANRMLDAFKEGAGEVGSIMLEKGKRKSAVLVAGEIVAVARKASGEHWPKWLEGPKAQRAALFLIPFNVGMLIKVFAPKHVAAAAVIAACSYAYKGVAEEVADDVSEYVVPMMADLAKIGAGIGVSLVSNQLSGGKSENAPKITATVEEDEETKDAT